MSRETLLKLLILSALLIGLPLSGVALSGEPVARYLEFPPLTRYVEHAPVAWPAFVVVAALSLALFVGLAYLLVPGRSVPAVSRTVGATSFPGWGWLGAVLLAVSWTLAWTRFDWFRPLQPYTFTPLWLSYILLLNALTYRRTRRCLLTERPRFFLLLFPLSALFWWYFEFLNRFVQNWYYVGIETFSPVEYVLHATLAFSTVLPAVISTTDWLRSCTTLGAARCSITTETAPPRWVAVALMVAACLGLGGIGVWPDVLFPLLWVAPLVLVVALQVLFGERTIFAQAARGDWRVVSLPALAALICGLFWELWNYFSYAKWIYSIPLVHRFEIFEMPLLGYAGYLPFGLECAVIAGLIDSERQAQRND